MASTWISLLNFFVIIFILAATGFAFFAYSYVTTPSNATATTVSNNTSAQNLLLWAGIIGIVVFLFLIFYMVISYFYTPVDMTNPMAVAGPTGWTFLFYFFLMAALIVMVILIAYALYLLDSTVTGNQNARTWAIVAIVMGLIAFVLEFIVIILAIIEYRALPTVNTEVVVSKPSELANVFYFSRNPNTKGKFNGTISLTGELREANQFIEYNGQIIENTKKAQAIPIDVAFPINEGAVMKQVVERPVVKRQVVERPVVERPVVVEKPVVVERVQQPARIPSRQQRQVEFI